MEISKVITNELTTLIQKDNYVGKVYFIDYDIAFIATHDYFKEKVGGIPLNSFLIASSIDVDNFANMSEFYKEVILLRVVGSQLLPKDEENVNIKLDKIDSSVSIEDHKDDMDILTKNQIAQSGLKCRVIGTFYIKDNQLQLGSDIENFSSSLMQNVYLPKGEALNKIVNYVDPIRKMNAKNDFLELGITNDVSPFEIGTVRYTSSDRLQRKSENELVPVSIQPVDFLARRTAVLGMTRTGKSNMVKHTISEVRSVSKKINLNIGQLIFDINGEYANANKQDKGAISDIFKEDCIRYRMIKTDGFESLLINFYEQLENGFEIIVDTIKELKKDNTNDILGFINGMSFDKPDELNEKKRYEVRIAIYKALLYKAGFECDSTLKVTFSANKEIKKLVGDEIEPEKGLPVAKAAEWFLQLRDNALNELKGIDDKSDNRKTWSEMLKSSSKGKPWLDDVSVSMINLLAMKNNSNTPINGYKLLMGARDYHTADRNELVYKEIYDKLVDGKIIILDLSVGKAIMRKKISTDLAQYIFNKSMETFTEGNNPPNITIYIEEAHNLIGKNMKLEDTWPRLAKEGAKYRIGLVYATQEVSSVHSNILSNTENWFVSHLNSETEIKEISKFYDFSDFQKSLLRAQDIGFTRIKTLSSPFVVPVQIHKFDPQKWSDK